MPQEGTRIEVTCKSKFRLTSSAHGVRRYENRLSAESSAERVTSSPPKLGGVRGGLNVGYNYRGLLHWPFFRPPRPSGSPPNLGGEEVTLSAETPHLVYSRTSIPRVRSMSIEISIYMFSPVLVQWRRQPTWQIKAHRC